MFDKNWQLKVIIESIHYSIIDTTEWGQKIIAHWPNQPDTWFCKQRFIETHIHSFTSFIAYGSFYTITVLQLQ